MQGQMLPNGYVVVEVTVREDQWTVLAMAPWRDVDQFAVWSMRPNDPDSTHNGFYTSVLARAMVEYYRRSGRLEVIEIEVEKIQARDRHPANVVISRVLQEVPRTGIADYYEREED